MASRVRTKETEAVTVPKRRRLTDLFVVGKSLELDDGSGEPIEIWLSKISPVEQRDAADSATVARAKILALKNADPSDPALAVYREQIEDLGVVDRDTRIEFLIGPKLQEAYLSAEARIASEDPWAKDDYLTSLQKAWTEGLAEKYDEDPEDEEAKRIYDELVKFSEEVNEAVAEAREDLVAGYEGTPDEDIERQALERALDAESDFAWVNEFSRWQVYYSVREPEDHDKRYFVDRAEVDLLDTQILNRLITEYRELTVDAFEGKDSEETPSS